MTNQLEPNTKLVTELRTPPLTGARAAIPIFGPIFGPIMPNHPDMPEILIIGALLAASGLLISYMNVQCSSTLRASGNFEIT